MPRRDARGEDDSVVFRWTIGIIGGVALVAFGITILALDFSVASKVPRSKASKEEASKTGSLRSTGAGSNARFAEKEPISNPWRETLASLAAMETDAERARAIDTMIDVLAPSEQSAALRVFFDERSDGLSREIADRMIRRLAEAEPMRAAGEVEKLPEGAGRDEAMKEVAIIWASRDATEAANWVRRWPDEAVREQGMIGVSYEAARSDAVGAMTMAAELPPGAARDDLIGHVAAQWTAADPRAAADWAKKISNADLRARVYGTIATEWSAKDPVAAATMAASQLPAGRLRDDAVIGIVERWAQVDPTAAGAWVEQFPAGALRDTAMDNLAKLWPDGSSLAAGSR